MKLNMLRLNEKYEICKLLGFKYIKNYCNAFNYGLYAMV